MFWVYIIKNEEKRKYYIGYTGNLEKRLEYHNKGLNKSTRKLKWTLVYSKEFKTKREAILTERFIKKQKSRKFIEKLITG